MSELKVVIFLKDNKGLIGIQAPSCDPVFNSFEGDLDAALQQVPGLVDQANQQWDSNPRYPKADLPVEAQTTTTTPKPRAAESKPQSQQISWF